MGKPIFGTKCVCVGCSERFYDLNRLPATCPKCGVEQPPQKPRAVSPPRGMGGMRRLIRQPAQVVAEDDPEPVGATLIDDADDDADVDDEADIDPDLEADLDVAEVKS